MAKIYKLRRTSTLALRQRKAALLRRLAVPSDFLRASSYLDLARQTKRRRWRHLCGLKEPISDDTFAYVTERLSLEDLRQGLAAIAKTLKTNKALESAQINVLLDVEPIRPGEDEGAAALRLLGRVRRVDGPRFFDAITADAWYVQGPLLRAVEKLGWQWVVVLKREDMEVYQEAGQLSQGQKPLLAFDDQPRNRLPSEIAAYKE